MNEYLVASVLEEFLPKAVISKCANGAIVNFEISFAGTKAKISLFPTANQTLVEVVFAVAIIEQKTHLKNFLQLLTIECSRGLIPLQRERFIKLSFTRNSDALA